MQHLFSSLTHSDRFHYALGRAEGIDYPQFAVVGCYTHKSRPVEMLA